MSRLFSAAGTDLIKMIASGHAPPDQGPFTVMALVMMTANLTTDQWIVQGINPSGSPTFGLLSSGGKYFNESNFGTGGPAATLNAWVWIGFCKHPGAVASRWHTTNLTSGTAWSHTTDPSTEPDNTGPTTSIVIGGRGAGTSSFRGNIAAIAVWEDILTDGQIEAAGRSAATLKAAGPSWGVLLNQTSTATPVEDLSGFGATQASIAGTTVSAAEPPGWSYATSPAISIWASGAEVPAALSVWTGSAEVPANLFIA